MTGISDILGHTVDLIRNVLSHNLNIVTFLIFQAIKVTLKGLSRCHICRICRIWAIGLIQFKN